MRGLTGYRGVDCIYVAQERIQRGAVMNTVINIREHIKRREFPDQMNYNRLHSIGFLCFVQQTFCIGFGFYSAFLFLSVLSTAAALDVPANAGILCDKTEVLDAAIRERPCCVEVEWKRTESYAFRLGVHLMGFVQQKG